MAGLVLNLDTLKFEDSTPGRKGTCRMSEKKTGSKSEPKTEVKQPTEPAAAPKKRVMPKATGYKGHKAGSRKEQIHKLFDDKGADEAIAKGVELGVLAVTVKLWIREFKKVKSK